MAGGKNKAFLEQRERYVESNIIEVTASPSKLIEVSQQHVDQTKAANAVRGRIAHRGTQGSPQRDTGIFEFDLVDSGSKGEVLVNGRTRRVPILHLQAWGEKARDFEAVQRPGHNMMVNEYKTPKRAHPIRAYWTPWDANTAWSVQLGTDADFFFTQTMDGCTLGISSGANPIVTHGNYRLPATPDRADEGRTMQEIRDHHQNTHGVDVDKWLRKSQYVATDAEKRRGINRLVTVIGFRNPDTGEWKFYWQRRKIDATGPNAKIILQDRLVAIA